MPPQGNKQGTPTDLSLTPPTKKRKGRPKLTAAEKVNMGEARKQTKVERDAMLKLVDENPQVTNEKAWARVSGEKLNAIAIIVAKVNGKILAKTRLARKAVLEAELAELAALQAETA